MQKINVELEGKSYPILIGQGLLGDPKSYESLPKEHRACILSNTTVAPLYAKKLSFALQSRYQNIDVLTLPDGEAHKTWDSLNLILNHLLSTGADRKTTLFALGGGVVGDMTGFAAACFMRGIPFVQVPTTLLAQVDSSVGGKTAINHPLGKNMIGAFYQPELVICDLDTLKTLPEREISAGLAEVIKYGPIADMTFFEWLEANMDRLRTGDSAALEYAVLKSCAIKAQVVGSDEREQGVRAILNFGHTFGHAIEAGLGFGTWLHGEAVGCGMLMAARLSQKLGFVENAFVQRLQMLLIRAGLPTRAPTFNLSGKQISLRYLELMLHDKKNSAGSIQFIVLDPLGSGKLQKASEALVVQAIEESM